jgi:hypothetical protein
MIYYKCFVYEPKIKSGKRKHPARLRSFYGNLDIDFVEGVWYTATDYNMRFELGGILKPGGFYVCNNIEDTLQWKKMFEFLKRTTYIYEVEVKDIISDGEGYGDIAPSEYVARSIRLVKRILV